MNRTEWCRERRLWNEVQMDTIYARKYDEHWGGYINPSHQQMLGRLLELCPEGGRILDAACGTGKYWPFLKEKGFSIVGTDQSEQMLAKAHAKFPVVHIGLQELNFRAEFDEVMCMDAMEFAFHLTRTC